jgi:hypothetical protein
VSRRARAESVNLPSRSVFEPGNYQNKGCYAQNSKAKKLQKLGPENQINS